MNTQETERDVLWRQIRELKAERDDLENQLASHIRAHQHTNNLVAKLEAERDALRKAMTGNFQEAFAKLADERDKLRRVAEAAKACFDIFQPNGWRPDGQSHAEHAAYNALRDALAALDQHKEQSDAT